MIFLSLHGFYLKNYWYSVFYIYLEYLKLPTNEFERNPLKSRCKSALKMVKDSQNNTSSNTR